MEENMIELLNKVRSEASQMYQDRIPEATKTNLDLIRYAMTEGEDCIQVANEFMKTILNKVAKTEIHDKMWENPLAPLKQGNKPLGDTVEEIYSNFIKSDQDAFNGDNLFRRNLPDTKAIYHRKNYDAQYTVTVNKKKLKYAFSSFGKLESYISSVINAAYNSLHQDEFLNMKQIFARAIENNAIKTMKVPNPLKSKANAEAFIEQVKTVSGLMKYPSSKFNAYKDAQNVDETDLITFSSYKEQVLILPEAVNVKVDCSVLANTFNMTLAEFNKTRKLLIDEFPIPGCVGALVDEQFLQVYDDDLDVTEWFNPKGRYTNFYINQEQTISYSILVNAMLFITGEDTNSDGNVTTYTVTKELKEGVTLSNNRINVVEGNSYSTTIRGLAGGETVTVTMGGTDITSTAYNEGKVAIDTITGNIVIKVA